ncbi:alpha/beta fold hydrolase [Sphaerimonospora cavernae]|uniref:Alpha/beta fold hydrolase n=1 Tax=Sphaerimonospora cavernae TaxID=1740611 RepID=A0ABV6UC18_9ACTN
MDTTFVLIPGPWTGAWVWEPVALGLRRQGYDARPVTLSGLDSPDEDVSKIGLDTHIDDVLSVLETVDQGRVILVAHSYSGIVGGQVADRRPDLVAHTVFVEGFLPHNGRSMLHAFPERLRADDLRLIAANRGRWPAPDAAVVADGQDLTLRQARWLAERFVGHPGRTVAEPAALTRPLSSLRATYVVCEKEHFGGQISLDVSALRAEPGWTFESLDTGHWPMVSAPDRLVSLLTAVAARV